MPNPEEIVHAHGVHIRMIEELNVEFKDIARLTVLVYPLPAGALVVELGQHIQKATHEFLLAKGLVEEGATDLMPKGTIQ